jgi:protein-tyrosine phosphatase
MTTELFWVPTQLPGRLAVAPRPRGGDWLDDEIVGWQRSGVDRVVSLLTPEESAELDLDGEAAACLAHGVEFRSLPVPDRDVPPSRSEFRACVDEIVRGLGAGHRVVVHCRQGIGRAGMLASAALIATGVTPQTAVDAVSAARTRPVPETPAQREWLNAFAKDVSAPVGAT